jgi:histidine phosphotransferase ChpT
MTLFETVRLCELLSARLCHELARPLQAIFTGCDLIDAEEPDLRGEAAALVKGSARHASSRLQFYRFAYGFGGSGSIASAVPHMLAEAFFAGTPLVCDYDEEAKERPLDWQKLACNLLVVAAEALPRGGRLALSCGPSGPEVKGIGEAVAVSPEVLAALALQLPLGDVDARTTHAYFTGLVAASLGHRPSLTEQSAGHFRLVALPLP